MSVEAYLARRAGVEFGEVSLGYRTVTLLAADEIAAEQEGYGGEGWELSWLVIATEDELGDPIVTDLSVAKMPVFTLEHGEDEWRPVPIADSFDGFVRALQSVAALAESRPPWSSSRALSRMRRPCASSPASPPTTPVPTSSSGRAGLRSLEGD